jgi:hypothetical protein
MVLTKKAVAYVEEAGEKGLIRNPIPALDQPIGLLGGLVTPTNRMPEFKAAVRQRPTPA